MHVLCDLTYISTLEKKSKFENTEAVKRQFKLPKGNFSLFPIKYILIIIFSYISSYIVPTTAPIQLSTFSLFKK